MFSTRLFAGLVLAALALTVGSTNSARAQESIPRWRYRLEVEVTYFNGNTYWSLAYETTNRDDALKMYEVLERLFEEGVLQEYFGSQTSYASDIRFRTISNITAIGLPFPRP